MASELTVIDPIGCPSTIIPLTTDLLHALVALL